VKRYLLEHENPILINGYGPTENTTFTCTFQMQSSNHFESSVPIGRPIANTQAHLIDERMNILPIGAPGELVTGGAGLARGYLNRPDLTADKFTPDPFSGLPGARLYRTGDIARYRPDGNIEFIGRRDMQVKLRGFRVELGEIEAVLKDNPQVIEAVVMAHQDHTGNKRLIAYILVNNENPPDANELRDAARKKLPDFMVPSAFLVLQDMPLTHSGKIDRRALPAPDRVGIELKDLLLPRDAVELRLIQVWEEVLGIQPIGLQNNFFDLGGHSLLAVHLMSRIEQEFGEKLPLGSLFQWPTVEGLARLIRRSGNCMSRSSLVKIQPGGAEQPFFCVHPSGGNVFCYTALAHHLGPDQPFYGLQAQGLDGAEPAHTTVEEMAAHYIEAMREIQPAGPYLLGGWSLGGVVAFEMARQIEEQGDNVDLLVLMDARNPVLDRDLHREADDLAQLEGFALQIGVPPDYLEGGRDRVSQCEPEARLSFILEQAKIANVLPGDLGLSQMQSLFDVFNSNLQALRSYVPQTRRGRIVLLKASKGKRNLGWDSSLGWDGLNREGVEVYEVPGNHFGMMRPPNVNYLADQLAACIRRTSPEAATVAGIISPDL
jgi:thioesterase domain-containing protein/acyl carrier protein